MRVKLFLFVVYCVHTRKSSGKEVTFLEKCLDGVAANSATATRILPSCSHVLRIVHLHPHHVHTHHPNDKHFCGYNPTNIVHYICCTHLVYTVLSFRAVLRIRGFIVVLCTFEMCIRMTTSPSLSNIPKIGGFSFRKVPLSRFPFKRLRRPSLPFAFTAFGFPLCPAVMYTSSTSTSPLSWISGFFLQSLHVVDWSSFVHRLCSSPVLGRFESWKGLTP